MVKAVLKAALAKVSGIKSKKQQAQEIAACDATMAKAQEIIAHLFEGRQEEGYFVGGSVSTNGRKDGKASITSITVDYTGPNPHEKTTNMNGTSLVIRPGLSPDKIALQYQMDFGRHGYSRDSLRMIQVSGLTEWAEYFNDMTVHGVSQKHKRIRTASANKGTPSGVEQPTP